MPHIGNRQYFLNHLAQTSDAPLLLEIVRAEGHYLYDNSGKKFLDLISGISVSSLGHRDPHILEAIQGQLDQYLHLMVYGEVVQSPQILLAEALRNVLPPRLDNFYFVNSGSEAIEGAMKLAKRYTGRSVFIAQNNAYHGGTQGALSLMSNEYYSAPYKPLLPDVVFIDAGDIDALANTSEIPAAVVLELVQAERGAIPASKEYVQSVRAYCNQTGALMIVDEIQTGMGRTGTMFAFEQYGIIPDVLVLGKALGGGMPIGAFIANKQVMQCLSENPVLGHITTFGGHPVSCAAATAAVNVTAQNQQKFRVKEKEQLFRAHLQHPKIRKIEGVGLLLAVHLDSEQTCKHIILSALNEGIFTDWFLYAPDALRIAPPLSITDDEIIETCKTIIDILN
ncbi:MAG: aspartate aminotransferase family protein [Sphingomonadales bacterium]|jgi:acetylornithine/succinyldiaminopimelate/putrescine aminotransferase